MDVELKSSERDDSRLHLADKISTSCRYNADCRTVGICAPTANSLHLPPSRLLHTYVSCHEAQRASQHEKIIDCSKHLKHASLERHSRTRIRLKLDFPDPALGHPRQPFRPTMPSLPCSTGLSPPVRSIWLLDEGPSFLAEDFLI